MAWRAYNRSQRTATAIAAAYTKNTTSPMNQLLRSGSLSVQSAEHPVELRGPRRLAFADLVSSNRLLGGIGRATLQRPALFVTSRRTTLETNNKKVSPSFGPRRP